MSEIDKAIAMLLDLGIATPEEIIGCSSTEIEEISNSQSVKLPEVYREFLAKMGRRAGKLYIGTDFFYPDLLVLKKYMLELLSETKVDFILPDNAFVFLSHQAYMYVYFICETAEADPAVYFYQEGDSISKKSAEKFSKYLLGAIHETKDRIKYFRD